MYNSSYDMKKVNKNSQIIDNHLKNSILSAKTLVSNNFKSTGLILNFFFSWVDNLNYCDNINGTVTYVI